MGTPDFSVPSLDLLLNHESINLTHVISMPDRKSGRGYELKSPEVIEFAKKNKINFFQSENINKEEALLSEISRDTDLIIVLAFAQFLGQKVLDIPKIGCFNIHTSLLPKYRGAAPIQYTLLNGDKTGGVSIQKMVKKMDAGDLVHSKKLQIPHNQNGGHLYTRLKFQAALSLSDFLEDVLEEKIIFTPQDEEMVSFAPTLKKDDGFLDFAQSSFSQLHNQIRALDPWPGTYCFLNTKRLKVFSIEEVSNKNLKPGESELYHNQIIVGIKDKTIRLCDIQLEGKKRSSDTSLANGLKESIVINPKG